MSATPIRQKIVNEAALVGRDVVDCVGGRLRRVEDDVGDERAVEEGLNAEVEVRFGRRVEVSRGRRKVRLNGKK